MLFALYDTETTGLPFHFQAELSQQPRIIEFAGIITDGKDVIDQFEIILNPSIAIEEIITKITGLTNEDLADKPDFIKAVPSIKKFFSQAEVAVAHNLSFDKAMLQYDLSRRGLDLSAIDWPQIEICTVEQTMPHFGRRMKLEDLYNRYCGTYVQKHRAMDDVQMLHEVCRKIGLYDVFS